MGYINQIKDPNLQAFPGAIFEASGDVPEAECQETEIAGNLGTTTLNGNTLSEPAKFPAIDLTSKILSISAPPANVGDYTILSNTNDLLTLASTTPEASAANVYTIHDSGQTYLTRNIPSLARFIDNAGYAYTIKGGVIYTDCPDLTLANACSDTWNPGE